LSNQVYVLTDIRPFGDDVFVPPLCDQTPVANRLLKEFTNRIQQQNAATKEQANHAEVWFSDITGSSEPLFFPLDV